MGVLDPGSGGGPWDFPEHDVAVSGYELDKYEVTVGRFRRFIEHWDFTPFPSGAGAHPRIPGSGWRSSWNRFLPASQVALQTSVSLGADALPVARVTWYEAFTFCVWDGGRLPTEAEWEYAAAGGDSNREFPWGQEPPTADRLVFCGDGGLCDRASVGSKTAVGDGRWGHRDLAGNVSEWVLDAYGLYNAGGLCEDCANTDVELYYRIRRGGSFSDADQKYFRGSFRLDTEPVVRVPTTGFRCARSK